MQLHPPSCCLAASRQSAAQVPSESWQSKRTASLKHCNQATGEQRTHASLPDSSQLPAAGSPGTRAAAICSAAAAVQPHAAARPPPWPCRHSRTACLPSHTRAHRCRRSRSGPASTPACRSLASRRAAPPSHPHTEPGTRWSAQCHCWHRTWAQKAVGSSGGRPPQDLSLSGNLQRSPSCHRTARARRGQRTAGTPQERRQGTLLKHVD